jgi:RNA polymerase sigma-70 factor (ECF subfamily)
MSEEFASQVITHYPALLRYARMLSRRDHEDLVQETVAKALVNKDAFTSGTNLRAWLRTILYNLFISNYRKDGKVFLVDIADHIDAGISPERQEDSIYLKQIFEAVRSLSEDKRLALYKIAWRQNSYESVSAVTGVSINTLKTRVNRARTIIRES